VKKTRQNKRLELGSDSIRTEKALVDLGSGLWDAHPAGKRARPRRVKGYSLGSKIKKYREFFSQARLAGTTSGNAAEVF
jgi:hypothetical protein